MSFECVNWAYEQELKSGPKFVLVTLANICNQHGLCYPGQIYLAERTGFGERSVWAHLDTLEELQLIKRTRRLSVVGRRTSDWCQLQVPWREDQPARDADRPKATRKKQQAYPQKTADLPANIAGNTSETHQRTASEGARSRRTKLPTNWQPEMETVIWALEKGFSHEEIGRECESFADSALAHGRLYADWQAAFKSWLQKAPDFAGQRGGSGKGHRRGNSSFIETIARAAEGNSS